MLNMGKNKKNINFLYIYVLLYQNGQKEAVLHKNC